MASVTHSPPIKETLLNSSYGNGKYRRPKASLSASVPVGTELGSEIQTSLWLSLTMAPASISVLGTGTWAKQFPKWSSRRTAGTRGHGRGRTWIWSCVGMGRPCSSKTVPCAAKIVSYIPVIFVLRKHKYCYYCSSHITIKPNRFSLPKVTTVSEQANEYFLQGSNTVTSRFLNGFWVKWAPTGKRS